MIAWNTSPVRLALVGAGDVAGRHMPGWQRVDGGRLDVVVDVDPSRARAFAERWGVPRWETEFEKVAGQGEVDGADICLPPHLHAEAVRAFVERGKHVIVEKPLTPTIEEARDLAALVGRSEVVGMVAENWRFATATEQVADLVERGALGDLFMVKAVHESDLFADLEMHAGKHPWGFEAPGGGFMLRAGIHSVNLARDFLGEYASLFAFSTENRGFDREAPDTDTVVSAKFRSGAVGTFCYTGRSRHLGPRRMQMTLFGTRGHVWFDLLTGEVVHTADGVETSTRSGRASLGYAEEVQHFVDCVRADSPPRTDFAQQIAGLAATLAAYRSLDEGRPVSPAELLP